MCICESVQYFKICVKVCVRVCGMLRRREKKERDCVWVYMGLGTRYVIMCEQAEENV